MLLHMKRFLKCYNNLDKFVLVMVWAQQLNVMLCVLYALCVQNTEEHMYVHVHVQHLLT